jgi:hypothetical protein
VNTWHNKTQADLENVQNIKHIDIVFQWNPQKDKVNIITNGLQNEGIIYGTGSNFKTDILNPSNQTIHLQGHWGSGVLFQQIVIQRSSN